MPDPTATPASPTPDLLISALKQLPPTARVLGRLQHLLMDPNSGLEDITMLLKLDASLVTRIIHISNSVLFRRGEPCRNIDEAVNRVGFREIYRLVAMAAASSLVAGPLPAYGMGQDQVWEESVCCAIGAGLLADNLNEDAAVAYACGLLHAIGRLPVNQYLQGLDKGRVLGNAGFPLDRSHAEFALLAFNQADVSARMLQKWDFPPTVIEPVRSQYAPLSAKEPHDLMACLLYASRLLYCIEFSGTQPEQGDDEEEILSVARLDRPRLAAMGQELRKGFERARQITQSLR